MLGLTRGPLVVAVGNRSSRSSSCRGVPPSSASLAATTRAMVVHLLWIINQSGQLITKTAFTSPDNIGELGANPDMQLTLSSVLFSTCGMSQQLTPNADPLDSACMTLIECKEHHIHVYETPTSVKFVLVSDNRTMECRDLFKELHALYAEFATKNPFHTVDDAGIGQPIRIPAFTEAIRATVAKYQRV